MNSTNDTAAVCELVSEIVLAMDITMACLDVFGVLGNIISFFVLLFGVRSTAMYTILRALAVSDTIYLFCHFFFQVLLYNDLMGEMSDIARFAGYNGVGSTAESISVWLTVLLSVERYFAATKPLHSRTIFTKQKTIVWICITWTAPMIYRTSLLALTAVQFNQDLMLTESVTIFQNTTWIAQSVISVGIVTLCNVIIVWKVRKAKRKWSSNSSRNDRHELRNTLIPLWVMTMFLLSQVPQKLYGVLRILNVIEVDDNVTILIHAVSEACAVTNSSTNIIIYFACSRSIRQRIFRWFASHGNPKHSLQSSKV